jgi:hypothetical protein
MYIEFQRAEIDSCKVRMRGSIVLNGGCIESLHMRRLLSLL